MMIKEMKAFDMDELLALYASVGWTNYTDNPEMLERAYEHSLLTLEARDRERLVGIIRVVGDGYSIVFIQDLLVHPEYQRQGIGTQLLRRIMERFSDVYQMELLTDDTPGTISFYQSVGLRKTEGACTFIRMHTGDC